MMETRKQIIGIIPARFGSRRFPGKPLANILGKTLIQRTYENARTCSLLQDLLVATDDQRIFDHVVGFGGKAVMTSATCHSGTERLADVVKRSGAYDEDDLIVGIQGDEPILNATVIEHVITLLLDDPAAVMATAAVPIASKEEASDPSIVKCVIDLKGNALYFSRTLIPCGHQGKWQPKNISYFKHLGIYAYRCHFLKLYSELPLTPLQMAEDLEQLKALEHGHTIKVAVTSHDSIGVDTFQDIDKLEHMLSL